MDLIKTNDGSFTLFSSAYNEAYHSQKDGAFKESLYKHVLSAFRFIGDKKELNILDICYGLGYNSLTTLYYLKQNNLDIKVNIFSPELDKKMVESLVDFKYPLEFREFRDIIESISKNGFYKDKNISIKLYFQDAREFLKEIDIKFDIVYQDPFSPKKNPLLWTREYFKDLSKIVKDDFILTTYSIATPVRIAMSESGFRIYENVVDNVRRGTIASFKELPLKEIDIELKKIRNPLARSLRDIDFIK